jgi:hypothetical protein
MNFSLMKRHLFFSNYVAINLRVVIFLVKNRYAHTESRQRPWWTCKLYCVPKLCLIIFWFMDHGYLISSQPPPPFGINVMCQITLRDVIKFYSILFYSILFYSILLYSILMSKLIHKKYCIWIIILRLSHDLYKMIHLYNTKFEIMLQIENS